MIHYLYAIFKPQLSHFFQIGIQYSLCVGWDQPDRIFNINLMITTD